MEFVDLDPEELFEGRKDQWAVGCPIPLDQHAVSVSLPKWADVVGYEEGEERVTQQMSMGYPRFKVHSSIDTFNDYCREKFCVPESMGAIALPGSIVANRFVTFVGHSEPEMARNCVVYEVKELSESLREQLAFVSYPIGAAHLAKAFWQHTGEIPSSRLVECCLRCLNLEPPSLIKRYSSDDLTALVDGETEQKLSLDVLDRREEYDGKIKERILKILEIPQADPRCCRLTVSGMAAVFTGLRVATSFHRTKNLPEHILPSTIVFGFPYLDTLKLNQRSEFVAGGCTFMGVGEDEDLDTVEKMLREQNEGNTRVCALFTEIPSNPLLKLPDLARLSKLALEFDFLLIVDDTISGFAQVDLLSGEPVDSFLSSSSNASDEGKAAAVSDAVFRAGSAAQVEDGTGYKVKVDMLCSSLTKIFSGRGDVLAGSVVINPGAKHGPLLTRLLSSESAVSPNLFCPDMKVLYNNSESYEIRCLRIMQVTHQLAEWLEEHPMVAKVWHPCLYKKDSLGQSRVRQLLRNRRLQEVGDATPGLGCLLSLMLKGTEDSADTDCPRLQVISEAFFDNLHCLKGPSLGTPYTLCCPYTLLAHYAETDWAKQQGVPRCLIRVSVGLEPWEVLRKRFEVALDAAAEARESVRETAK